MNVASHIKPLNINGLAGRMLVLEAPKNKDREILLLYGHHASLERMAGVAEVMNDFGAVTMPDLPGFGGMDSFYKIGMKPTLDNMADYLAAFIKLRFKRKKITIVGMSFGFVVATRMLQLYPKMTDQVDIMVSLVGFCHYDELIFTRPRFLFYRYVSSIFSNRLPSLFFRNVVLHPSVLRFAYAKTHNAKNKFANLSPQEAKRAMDFEIHLWHCNDVRTYMDTTVTMLTLNNCNVRIPLSVEHVRVDSDQYFDNNRVEQHMRVIFSDFHEHRATLDTHAPSIIADKAAAAGMMPSTLRQKLNEGSI